MTTWRNELASRAKQWSEDRSKADARPSKRMVSPVTMISVAMRQAIANGKSFEDRTIDDDDEWTVKAEITGSETMRVQISRREKTRGAVTLREAAERFTVHKLRGNIEAAAKQLKDKLANADDRMKASLKPQIESLSEVLKVPGLKLPESMTVSPALAETLKAFEGLGSAAEKAAAETLKPMAESLESMKKGIRKHYPAEAKAGATTCKRFAKCTREDEHPGNCHVPKDFRPLCLKNNDPQWIAVGARCIRFEGHEGPCTMRAPGSGNATKLRR